MYEYWCWSLLGLKGLITFPPFPVPSATFTAVKQEKFTSSWVVTSLFKVQCHLTYQYSYVVNTLNFLTFTQKSFQHLTTEPFFCQQSLSTKTYSGMKIFNSKKLISLRIFIYIYFIYQCPFSPFSQLKKNALDNFNLGNTTLVLKFYKIK